MLLTYLKDKEQKFKFIELQVKEIFNFNVFHILSSDKFPTVQNNRKEIIFLAAVPKSLFTFFSMQFVLFHYKI